MAEVLRLPDIPLWSRWPREKLLAKQADDPRSFARGYQMRAYDDSELLFPSFGQCREHSVKLGEIVRAGWPMFAGVDLSSEQRPGTCIFVLALEPSTLRRYPVSVRLGAWSSPQTVGQLSTVLNEYPSIQTILVENNAYQQALVDWIRTTQQSRLWLKVESFTTTAYNKPHPEYGLPSLEAEFSKHMWVVPYNEYEHHNPACLCGWCSWDRQMTNYPHSPETDCVMACVAPGARVTTARGPVPVEEVVVGDLVLTHRSRWRKVTATTWRQHDGDGVYLRPYGGRGFVLTPEHPVWSATSRFERADRSNRLVPTAWSFRPSEEFRVGRKAAGDFAFTPVPSRWAEDCVEALVSEDGVAVPVDVDLATAVGLYLAEGSIGGEPHQVSFALHAREEYLSDFLCRVLARFDARGHVRVKGNERRVTFSSRRLVGLFSQFGKRVEKGLPWGLMGWPLPLREAVVRGWFLGDGCLYDGRLSGVSISPTIVAQVEMTLQQLGLGPSVNQFMHAGRPSGTGAFDSKDSWKVTLTRSDTARFLARKTAEEVRRWPAPLPAARERTNSARLPVVGGLALRMLEKLVAPYSGPVYNMHVEEDESYVVEGVAVHNCWFAREAASKWLGVAGGLGTTLGDFNAR